MTDKDAVLIDPDDNESMAITETEQLVDAPAPSRNLSSAKSPNAILFNGEKGQGSIYSNSAVDFTDAASHILKKTDEEEEVLGVGNFTWEIKNFHSFTEQKYHSPVFTAGGHEWSILLFPRGNSNNNIALYLEPRPKKHKVEGSEEEEYVDPKWYNCAQFTFIISNPKNDKNFHASTSHQRFNKNAIDWGFSNFIDMTQLKRRGHNALMADDSFNITAFVKVVKDTTGVLWHNLLDYDSKQETGFVGFNNQGATCYLNSLLQSYFFTKSFRKAVYQIPTEGLKTSESVPFALQKVFYQLQRSEIAIETSELTKSFGWDTGDAFTQHDVQELNRILMDKLETSMKGTPVETILNETFVGQMKSYIKCINVDYESSRTEEFWDIQLNVKNLSNLSESFQNYIEVELMDGENQYAAQDFGLQDAKKGVIFKEFPKVLHLQLKRFEYDYNYDTLVKVNDRYEFPESIDLSPFLDNEDGSKSVGPDIYDLHGVLVHAGDLTTGHYYALIKPDKSGKWYRFDDDKVWRVTKRQVFEANFGIDALEPSILAKLTRPEQQQYQLRRHTSAYMLVYIKRDAVDEILEDVDEVDVPNNVSQEVDLEIEEEARKRKELEELHLYLNIKFYSNGLFKKYEGYDLGADQRLVAPDQYNEDSYPYNVKVLKTAKFTDLFPELHEKLGIDPRSVKFHFMSYRRNYTLRPSTEIPDIETLTIEELSNTPSIKKYGFTNIWIEQPELELFRSLNKTLDVISLQSSSSNGSEILVDVPKHLLLLKYYDVKAQTLNGFTHVVVGEDTVLSTLFPFIRESLGLSDETQLIAYEEMDGASITELDPNLSIYQLELTDGDILTIQTADNTSDDNNPNNIYPFYKTADKFYEYLRHRIHIDVRPLAQSSNEDEYVVNKDDNTEPFDFWISFRAPFEELVKRIALKINQNEKYIRVHVNYNGHRTLLRTDSSISDYISKRLRPGLIPFFEYDILTIPMKELEHMKLVKVNWIPSGYNHYQTFEFPMKENDTIGILLDKLQVKIDTSEDDKDTFIVWSNIQSRFFQVLDPETNIQIIDDSIDVFAASLPEEKQILIDYYYNDNDDPKDEKTAPKFAQIIQFFKDPRKLHGISFLFALYPGEKLKELKTRLQKRIGLGQKEFSKVQLCLWDPQAKAPEYLDTGDENGNWDDFVLYDEISETEYLALDHPDRTSRQGAQQNSAGGGISIR